MRLLVRHSATCGWPGKELNMDQSIRLCYRLRHLSKMTSGVPGVTDVTRKNALE